MEENSPFHAEDEDFEAAFPKADILERFLAKFIDLLIVGAFFAFPTFIGPLAGATYILISDGLKGGQSLGKRVIGLKVISLRTDLACDFKSSMIRNSVFGLLILFYFLVGWVPYAGKIIAFIVWAAVTGTEMMLIYSDGMGARFGDRIAGTMVISLKTAFGPGER